MPPRSASPRPWPVVLLTDFGPGSAYVGQMKLVLESNAPGVRTIDLAHDLPAQDTVAAALILKGALPCLPRPAVLCTVVDPGVGSARRILAAGFGPGRVALLPDNGLLAALQAWGRPTALRAVTNARCFRHPVSPVFHGRDCFAPVAAKLAQGFGLAKLGPAVQPSSLVPLLWPRVRAGLQGVRVIYADRFGNLVTNLAADEVPPRAKLEIRLGRRKLTLVSHYAEARPGQAVALWGSFGHLEIAVRDGSAARVLKVDVGSAVAVRAV